MRYAVVSFPNITSPSLQGFRKRYDPKWNLIAPHITLVFPLPESVGEDQLVTHIEPIAASLHSFPVTLEHTALADDGYLYLLVSEGQDKFITLHDDLYTEILSSYLRTDIPYVPHLTIGYFGEGESFQKDHYGLGQKELSTTSFRFNVVCDNLTLIAINDPTKERRIIKQFVF